MSASENQEKNKLVLQSDQEERLHKGQVTGTDQAIACSSEQPTIIIPLEDFADDLNHRLGRANGNVYHRRPGVEGVHDGQIMIRLKKKRFIVVDYGIVPNTADITAASVSSHISCSPGAGKQKCVTSDCSKVGVPVLLYDSDPTEPQSLYLRSGMCFTCQRLLNEKRRTQRKRKSDTISSATRVHPQETRGGGTGSQDNGLPVYASSGGNASHYNTSMNSKRFRLNVEILDWTPDDSTTNNGPMNGMKHHGPEYTYREIGTDVQNMMREALGSINQLVASTAVTSMIAVKQEDNEENETAAFAAAASAAAAAAVSDANPDDFAVSAAVDAANGIIESHTTSKLAEEKKDVPLSPNTASDLQADDPFNLYEKTLLFISKSVFMISQWKASWDHENNTALKTLKEDEIVASAITRNVVETSADSVSMGENPIISTSSGVSSNHEAIAEAVASAAAVAAAQLNARILTSEEQNSSNMVPLLLTADAEGKNKTEKNQEEQKEFLKVGDSNDVVSV